MTEKRLSKKCVVFLSSCTQIQKGGRKGGIKDGRVKRENYTTVKRGWRGKYAGL